MPTPAKSNWVLEFAPQSTTLRQKIESSGKTAFIRFKTEGNIEVSRVFRCLHRHLGSEDKSMSICLVLRLCGLQNEATRFTYTQDSCDGLRLQDLLSRLADDNQCSEKADLHLRFLYHLPTLPALPAKPPPPSPSSKPATAQPPSLFASLEQQITFSQSFFDQLSFEKHQLDTTGTNLRPFLDEHATDIFTRCIKWTGKAELLTESDIIQTKLKEKLIGVLETHFKTQMVHKLSANLPITPMASQIFLNMINARNDIMHRKQQLTMPSTSPARPSPLKTPFKTTPPRTPLGATLPRNTGTTLVSTPLRTFFKATPKESSATTKAKVFDDPSTMPEIPGKKIVSFPPFPGEKAQYFYISTPEQPVQNTAHTSVTPSLSTPLLTPPARPVKPVFPNLDQYASDQDHADEDNEEDQFNTDALSESISMKLAQFGGGNSLLQAPLQHSQSSFMRAMANLDTFSGPPPVMSPTDRNEKSLSGHLLRPLMNSNSLISLLDNPDKIYDNIDL